ncbi:MAG: hypothetical protein CBC17_002535 [Gammaproteobacteria bacterium TMED57]|nr:MAG: hypothetical protein CBC17_002535 [Gammaproteobacteria bacterium TMED57]
MNSPWAQEAWRVVKQQVAFGAGMVALAAVFSGSHASYSTLAGFLCVVVPSAYYAWVSQRTMIGPRIVAQGVLKIMGTGVLMALFLGLGSVQALWFLLGVVTAQISYLWVLAKGGHHGSELASGATHKASQKQSKR